MMTINIILSQIIKQSRQSSINLQRTQKISQSPINWKSFGRWYKDFWTPKKYEPPYSHVVQIGDPALRTEAHLVPQEEIKSQELKCFINLMRDVLRANKCVGLAAPQVGISLRIFVMEYSEQAIKAYSEQINKARETEFLPFTVFINPELKVLNFDKKISLEACASVRGYSAEVPRYYEVQVNGFNENGDKVEKNFRGWNARIAQHEMDHLNGQIYVDIMNTKTFNCTCWQAVNDKQGRIEIPFYPK